MPNYPTYVPPGQQDPDYQPGKQAQGWGPGDYQGGPDTKASWFGTQPDQYVDYPIYGGSDAATKAAQQYYADQAEKARQTPYGLTQEGFDPSGAFHEQQSYQQAQDSRNQALQAQGLLQAAAEGKTPSAAELQMQAGVDRATMEQASLAAGTRGGPGSRAAAQYNAGIQGAQMQGQGIQQAATLRAQEMAQARGQYAQAAMQQRATDLQAQGMSVEEAQRQAALEVQGFSAGQEAAMGYEKMGYGINQQNLEAVLKQREINAGIAQGNAGRSQQMVGGVMGAIGGLFGLSDINAKSDIMSEGNDTTMKDISGAAGQGGGGGGFLSGLMGGMMSDEEAKERAHAEGVASHRYAMDYVNRTIPNESEDIKRRFANRLALAETHQEHENARKELMTYLPTPAHLKSGVQAGQEAAAEEARLRAIQAMPDAGRPPKSYPMEVPPGKSYEMAAPANVMQAPTRVPGATTPAFDYRPPMPALISSDKAQKEKVYAEGRQDTLRTLAEAEKMRGHVVGELGRQGPSTGAPAPNPALMNQAERMRAGMMQGLGAPRVEPDRPSPFPSMPTMPGMPGYAMMSDENAKMQAREEGRQQGLMQAQRPGVAGSLAGGDRGARPYGSLAGGDRSAFSVQGQGPAGFPINPGTPQRGDGTGGGNFNYSAPRQYPVGPPSQPMGFGGSMPLAAPQAMNTQMQRAPNMGFMSDEEMKRGARKETDADRFLEHLHPYSYEYKQPEMDGYGRRLGVMAQDVERGPTGKTIVQETPRGKAIDGKAAISAGLAGLGRLHERVSALEARRR